jgi:hypothetical protein
MKTSIPVNTLIYKFFSEHNLFALYSQTVTKHLITFLTAMALKGFTAKMTDVAEISVCHRTTLSYFLAKGKWNEKPLIELNKNLSFNHIQQLSKNSNQPIFVSVDDTVNVKSKPSSKAVRPIEAAEYHYSHLEGKQVWGHQIVSVMVSCDGKALNYDLHRYDKSKESKIAYVQKMAMNLPAPGMSKAYALADSWYTNSEIIQAFAVKGYQYIGAIKTNRVIYPDGVKFSIVEFAEQALVEADFDLVTVKEGKEYLTYRYEGNSMAYLMLL